MRIFLIISLILSYVANGQQILDSIRFRFANGDVKYYIIKTVSIGFVTQATSKSTSVSLNNMSGEITTANSALAANTNISFTLNNSNVDASDLIVLNHVSGGTIGSYVLNGVCSSGSATIHIRNVTTGSLSQALVIRFRIIKQ